MGFGVFRVWRRRCGASILLAFAAPAAESGTAQLRVGRYEGTVLDGESPGAAAHDESACP